MGQNTIREKDLSLYFHEGKVRVRRKAGESVAKRGFDILATLAALVFLSVFFIPVGLLIWLQDGGSPLYAQRRVGRDGKMFFCLKFRTMVVDSAERLQAILDTDPAAREEWARDHKLRNDPRITPLGSFLRRSSLDELPQLLNILRGDMSLVGPRPIVESEIAKYGQMITYYQEVRPGLTGLWQISGRNDTSYTERVAMDVRYVRNWSFWNDISILLRTVPSVLKSKGAY